MRKAILFFLGSILLSTSVQAASFFSEFEYHSFWSDAFPIFVMAVLAICSAIYFRRKIRRHAATAPVDARRNNRERLFHYLSLLFICFPMTYTFFFETDLLWAQFGILGVQVAVMTVLRYFKVKFIFRFLCLIPACLLSIAVGEIILIWPHIELSLIEAGPHTTVALYGLSFSAGYFLSYISFPAAYRAQAW